MNLLMKRIALPIGTGLVSGTLSVFFGLLGMGGVLAFSFPNIFSTPAIRFIDPILWRILLHLVLVSGFSFGIWSILRRQRVFPALIGLVLVGVATLLGGSRIPLNGVIDSAYSFSLDLFLLNVLFYTVIFTPLERLWPLHPEQKVIRPEFWKDMGYFLLNAGCIQAIIFLVITPVRILFVSWQGNVFHAWLIGSPFIIKFLIAFILGDFMTYWVHRAFHSWKWLWPFHAVHHSATRMDWLAGYRIDLVDNLFMRIAQFIPLYVLGFPVDVMYLYLFVITVNATFIHSNVRWSSPWLRYVIATPFFHHWHHALEEEARDKNFSVHSQLFDWIFGTLHMPKKNWPKSYGL